MKAIIFTEYGSPDVLRLAEIPKPTLEPGVVEACVMVKNRMDWLAGSAVYRFVA